MAKAEFCKLCQRLTVRHDPACPEVLRTKASAQLWTDGYVAGICSEVPKSNNASYVLGHEMGKLRKAYDATKPKPPQVPGALQYYPQSWKQGDCENDQTDE